MILFYSIFKALSNIPCFDLVLFVFFLMRFIAVLSKRFQFPYTIKDNKIRHFHGIVVMVQTTTFFGIINWINSNRCAEFENDKLKGKF